MSCLFLVTASRMRACACDTASRLCVRTALCRSAFSLAPPLRSTGSAAAEAALFARFLATSGRSDFSIAFIVGYGLRPSRQPPGHDWRGQRWRPPGSRAKGFCACQGLRRRGVGMCLAISTPAVLPSVGRKTSAPRTCLTPLNTSPAPSPVNASRLPSRASRASLGAGAVRYSFTVTDFHRLPFAGLPAHPSTASAADAGCWRVWNRRCGRRPQPCTTADASRCSKKLGDELPRRAELPVQTFCDLLPRPLRRCPALPWGRSGGSIQ